MTDGGLFDFQESGKTGRKVRAKKPSAPAVIHAPPEADAVRSVSQVSALITRALADELPPVLKVAGEISNFSVSQRGHAYFTLKDAQAQLPCVIWREALSRIRFKIDSGLAIMARGSVKFYEPQGRVQFYVDEISPQGAGALEMAFRQLCDKLRLEGLFEAGRKRRLPRLPQRVVVVTSLTGDVLHDVLTTAHRRFSGLHVMVYPVAVQGPSAGGQIASALEKINNCSSELGGIDLILLVRGGGSLEDLWAFNEEMVARAIVAGHIPVATGIGHEPDITIADLVADLRGPTPTGVAELSIPDARVLLREIAAGEQLLKRDLMTLVAGVTSDLRFFSVELTSGIRSLVQGRTRGLEIASRRVAAIEPRHAIAQGWRRLENLQRRLLSGATESRAQATERLGGVLEALGRIHPLAILQGYRLKLEHLEKTMMARLDSRRDLLSSRLDSLRQQLENLSPQAVLERGFSITTFGEGEILRRAQQIHRGEVIRTRLADGQISSNVE